MAGSHGYAKAATTSVASIKSASQTVLRSALGKAERSIELPLARPICVKCMSREDAPFGKDQRLNLHKNGRRTLNRT
jgi:hypothetical protein